MRDEAERLGLPVAAKPDSQDICFVPSGNYADVVTRLRPDAGEPGEIVDRGRARAAVGTTASRGIRSGRGSASARRRSPAVNARWWWHWIRRAGGSWSARVDAGTKLVRLREVNWLISPPVHPLRCAVKLRAREAPQSALVTITDDSAEVHLDTPALPAPGQACVFYDGERVLGGGFIRRADVGAMVDAAGAADYLPCPSVRMAA